MTRPIAQLVLSIEELAEHLDLALGIELIDVAGDAGAGVVRFVLRSDRFERLAPGYEAPVVPLRDVQRPPLANPSMHLAGATSTASPVNPATDGGTGWNPRNAEGKCMLCGVGFDTYHRPDCPSQRPS